MAAAEFYVAGWKSQCGDGNLMGCPPEAVVPASKATWLRAARTLLRATPALLFPERAETAE